MKRADLQQLAHALVRLLRTRGPARWLALVTIAVVAAVLWWRPETWVSISNPSPRGRPGTADQVEAGDPTPSRPAPERPTDDARLRPRWPHDLNSRRGSDADELGANNSGPLDAEIADSTATGGRDWQAGTLQDEGRGVYRSPAGLVYTRGSPQGHRLKHVLTHSQDDPRRPGQHGVFAETDQDAIVALIDEAYLQAQQDRSVQRVLDRERTILTVNLRRVIGYIGGQSGNRRGRPSAWHVRLVLEGDRVITAYPVVP